MKPTLNKEEHKFFKTKYEKISGLPLPVEYLEKSDVYVFKKGNKIIGGFCINQEQPFRTLEIFSSSNHSLRLNELLLKSKTKEVTCFWIDYKFRKNILYNILYWHLMAVKASDKITDYVIYGTNSTGLAKIYDIPNKAILFHTDKVKEIKTYIFIAKSKNIMFGLQQQIFCRIFGINRNKFPKDYKEAQKKILNEISK